MNKITLSIIFALFAGPVLADKNTNVQGQTQYTKTQATGIGIGHSSSNSKAVNGGNKLKLKVKTGGVSVKTKTTDKSKVYADGGVSGGAVSKWVKFGPVSFGGVSNKAVTQGNIRTLGDDPNEMQIELICRSDSNGPKLSYCKKYFKEKTIQVRVSEFNEEDHEDYAIGW